MATRIRLAKLTGRGTAPTCSRTRLFEERARVSTLLPTLLMLLTFSGCTMADLDPGHSEATLSCITSDPAVSAESRIDACSALIRAGKESPGRLAGILFSRGSAYSEIGGYDRAIEDFDRALKLKPDSEAALLNRGNSYFGKGDYDRAIADYDRAIALKPDYPPAFVDRGNARLHKGDYDRAIADYDQAIKLKSDFAFAFQDRANAYVHKGDYDRAIADFDQAIKLKPDGASAYQARGRAYARKGAWDRAIADFGHALALKPAPASSYVYTNAVSRVIHGYDRGEGLGTQTASVLNDRCAVRAIANRELDAALADCNQAIGLAPNDATTLDSRALVWLRMGQFDKAVQDADGALTANPKMASSLFMRGVAKRRLGDVKAGDTDLAAARSLDPAVEGEFSRYGVQP
jgi:tetratricopeptide (TPR) repeat protein